MPEDTLYETALDLAQIGVITVQDGVIGSANAAASRLFGTDLVGRSLREFVHAKDRQAADSVFRVVRADRSVRHVRVQSRRLDDGRRMVVLTDETEAVLQRDRDRKDRIELEHAHRELERFAEVASDDLRAPLRHLASFGELLEEELSGELSDNAAQFLGYIASSTTRMRRIVSDLLQYARATRDAARFATVSLDGVVAHVAQPHQLLLAQEQGIIRWRDLPLVYGDRLLIERLCDNLIANAVAFRRQGVQTRIDIVAQTQDAMVRVEVSDNGSGIAPEEQEQVFEMFARGAARKGSGTGLGLALCRRVVEVHGGEIGMSSEPGVGSTFWFTLPRLQDGRHASDKRDTQS